jgi:hypothetical protein
MSHFKFFEKFAGICTSQGAPLVSRTSMANLPRGVNHTGGKFSTNINYTGGKFATGTTGVVDISEKPGQKIQNFDGLGLKSPF